MSPLRSRIEFAALLGVAALFKWLPLPMARWLARGVGVIGSRVIKLRKRVALANLRCALPNATDAELIRTYHSLWSHFAMVGAEMARLPRMTRERFNIVIDTSEIDVMRTALARGKGAIYVSGHLGNWEWLGASCSRNGIPFAYVVAPQTNKLVEYWMESMRRSAGAEIISRKDSVRGTLSALREGKVIAMLCDQDGGKAGVFVPFFGVDASTARGPAVFHLKTGAPLVFGTCCRQADGRYKLKFVELPTYQPTSDREGDERNVMAAITEQLEAEISKTPEQYLWLHRRWKTRPM